jgi:hypothetical protein
MPLDTPQHYQIQKSAPAQGKLHMPHETAVAAAAVHGVVVAAVVVVFAAAAAVVAAVDHNCRH